MFDELVHDWDEWIASGRGGRRLSRWADEHDALRGWEPVELRSPRNSERTDAMQAALVALAQQGETPAVTTLITQLRPGLVSLAHRLIGFDRRVANTVEAEGEVLSTFGEIVLAHRLDRRPRRIAANLLLDSRQRLWRAGRRAALVAEAMELAAAATTVGAGCSSPEARTDELDLVAAVATALDRMPGSSRSRRLTAEVAYRAWILGEPSGSIASSMEIGPEAVRTRLCRLRALVRDGRSESVQDTSASDGSAPPSSPVGPSLASRQ